MPDSAKSNLAIVGYGKMGKLVETLAAEYDFNVVLKLDEFNNANGEGITAENFRGVDAAIDFSIPAAVPFRCRWLYHLPSFEPVRRMGDWWQTLASGPAFLHSALTAPHKRRA